VGEVADHAGFVGPDQRGECPDRGQNQGERRAEEIECQRRESEADFVSRWETGLRQSLPELAIRHEAAPTRGLGGYLRESFPDLASIRLTANSSAFLVNRPVAWMALKKALIATIPRD
jgi:hypothetical protein